VAQGAGPIKRTPTRWAIRMLGRFANYLSMRDPESYELVKGMLREKDRSKLHLTSDSALLSTLTLAAPAPPTDRPVVGMNLRQWFHLHFALMPYDLLWGLRKKGGTPALSERMDALLANFALLADHCVETHGAKILFIPMYPPGRQDWEIDDRLAHMVIDRMRHPEAAAIHVEDTAPEAFLRVFQSLSAMVGVRLHSTIVATACGVPSLHVTYSPKGRSYYKLLGEEMYALDIEDVAREGGHEALIKRFDRLWQERDAYARRLREAMPRLTDLALEPVRALAGAVRSPSSTASEQ
jgi:polysaccharide pyruvyl transferase WcaK-like protein